MGRHAAKPAERDRPLPSAPQTEPDPKDSRYDLPKTFGKGWNR
jgi:hypothetical protein